VMLALLGALAYLLHRDTVRRDPNAPPWPN
jgi:hypothetical protein